MEWAITVISPTPGSLRDAPKRFFERVAREIGALPVVAIFENAPARWPREQDRGYVRAEIMDDLSKSIYSVIEMIVESMHIDENAPAMRQILFHPGLCLPHSRQRGDFKRGEIGVGIGQAGSPAIAFVRPAAARRAGWRR